MNYSIYIPEHEITIYVSPEYAITNKPGILVKYYEKVGSNPDWPEYHEKKIPVQIKTPKPTPPGAATPTPPSR